MMEKKNIAQLEKKNIERRCSISKREPRFSRILRGESEQRSLKRRALAFVLLLTFLSCLKLLLFLNFPR